LRDRRSKERFQNPAFFKSAIAFQRLLIQGFIDFVISKNTYQKYFNILNFGWWKIKLSCFDK